jgi:hypothetical protein
MLLLSVLAAAAEVRASSQRAKKAGHVRGPKPLRTIHALHSILCVSGVLKLDESEAGRLPCHPYAPDRTHAVELRQNKSNVSSAQDRLRTNQAQFRAAASCITSSSSSRSVVSGLNPPTYTRHPVAMAAGYPMKLCAG